MTVNFTKHIKRKLGDPTVYLTNISINKSNQQNHKVNRN